MILVVVQYWMKSIHTLGRGGKFTRMQY